GRALLGVVEEGEGGVDAAFLEGAAGLVARAVGALGGEPRDLLEGGDGGARVALLEEADPVVVPALPRGRLARREWSGRACGVAERDRERVRRDLEDERRSFGRLH